MVARRRCGADSTADTAPCPSTDKSVCATQACPASALLRFRQERCGTDTLVCAGEARQDREDHYGFDSLARNSFAFANADASPSTIARTISAIASTCGRRLSRFASMIG